MFLTPEVRGAITHFNGLPAPKRGLSRHALYVGTTFCMADVFVIGPYQNISKVCVKLFGQL